MQLLLDAIFFICWIAAAATSQETCSDMCSACVVDGGMYYYLHVQLGSVQCTCPDPSLARRDMTSLLYSRGASSSVAKDAAEILKNTTEITLKQGFDGALV